MAVAIDREGPEVLLNLRQAGKMVALQITTRAAATLAASFMAATIGEEDADFGFEVYGILDVKEKRP